MRSLSLESLGWVCIFLGMVLSYGLPLYPNLGKVRDVLEYIKCIALIHCIIFLQV